MAHHKSFYELEGIRPDGSVFTGEILGRQTFAEAVSLARYFANLWGQRVRLYRVPYLNTSSAPWAEDEREFIYTFTCEQCPQERTLHHDERTYYERWLDGAAA